MKKLNYRSNGKRNEYAVVTGASHGIGKHIAFELANEGYHIVLIALPGYQLDQAALEVRARFGVDTLAIGIDLADENAPQVAFNEVQTRGIVPSILVNNAGYGYIGHFEDYPLSYHIDLIKVNSLATIQFTYLFLPLLKQHAQAYIMNMSSMASLMPVPFKTVYSAAKHFVQSFTLSLREELRDSNISITAVCPNAVLTHVRHSKHVEASGWLGRQTAMTPEKVARISTRAMFRQRASLVPGWRSSLGCAMLSLLPYKMKMNLVYNQIRKSILPPEWNIAPQVAGQLHS